MRDPLPCPFCGSTDVGGASGVVHCYRCEARIEVQNTNTDYAVQLWNRRRLPDAEKHIDEIRALLHRSDWRTAMNRAEMQLALTRLEHTLKVKQEKTHD